ncbi:MAG: D-alanyl-D-alanine carboxypeptidase, partial [Thermostichus sp. DG02_5_bins_236]
MNRHGWGWLNRRLVLVWVGLCAAGILLGLALSLPASHAAESGSLQPQVDRYLAQLAQRGFPQTAQGVWLQTGERVLAQHQGSTPLPAASLTKVATTLASLHQLGPEHRFVTLFGTFGSVGNGVLQGDLWVLGGEDPLFVWEEAIAVGNVLNAQGIRQVTGDLVIA